MNLMVLTYDETALEVSDVTISLGAKETFENANFDQSWMAFSDLEFTMLGDESREVPRCRDSVPDPNDGVAEIVFNCG